MTTNKHESTRSFWTQINADYAEFVFGWAGVPPHPPDRRRVSSGGQISAEFFLNSSFVPGFLYQKAVKQGTILLAVLS